MRPYVVWSPPWDHKVGGIRALYALAAELADHGCRVTVVNDGDPVDPNEIVVYPEIVTGNPFHSERVVRWRLAPEPVTDDGLVFDWTDYGGPTLTLAVDIVDTKALARRDGPRSGIVVWVHKGRRRADLIPDGAVELTRQWPPTRTEVIDLLAGAEYVVSFDEFSTVNVEAILLGTPVLLYPSGRFTRQRLDAQGWPAYGVAWSLDELDAAREATAGAHDWYAQECRRFEREVDRFVRLTQERWPDCG